MKFASFVMAASVALGIGLMGCESKHAEGVKSDIRTQGMAVNADPRAATNAAADVLRSQGLKDVTSEATGMDGEAQGPLADGTKGKVSVDADDDGSRTW